MEKKTLAIILGSVSTGAALAGIAVSAYVKYVRHGGYTAPANTSFIRSGEGSGEGRVRMGPASDAVRKLFPGYEPYGDWAKSWLDHKTDARIAREHGHSLDVTRAETQAREHEEGKWGGPYWTWKDGERVGWLNHKEVA